MSKVREFLFENVEKCRKKVVHPEKSKNFLEAQSLLKEYDALTEEFQASIQQRRRLRRKLKKAMKR